MLIHVAQQLVVVFNVDNHVHKRRVFRRSPDHRRAANVDVLDAGVIIRTRRHSGLKRVEVHHQQVDAGNAVFFHRRNMLLIVPQRQQTTMHIWVQRFYAAIHHFRKAGHIRHVFHRKTRIAHRFGGTPSGEQLNAAV